MEETPTLSERNHAPAAFCLNQSSTVCLPLMSDSKRLLWVSSNQINQQPDGVAELDKAFNRFPYLTQNQIAALAQRCSLHPDQVKVWFMVQRLCYGISWDYKDILNVQRKFSTSRGKEELKTDRRKNNKWKREVKESDRKRAGEVREEQRMTVTDKMGKKTSVGEGVEEVRKKNKSQAFGVPPLADDQTSSICMTEVGANLEGKPCAESTNPNGALSDGGKLKEVREVADNHVAAHSRPRIHSSTTTHSQLVMMKAAFVHCQYPDREGYDQMAMVIGVPRAALVEWFSDMRYYIKKRIPRWMNQEQHQRALANVKYQQHLNSKAKLAEKEPGR